MFRYQSLQMPLVRKETTELTLNPGGARAEVETGGAKWVRRALWVHSLAGAASAYLSPEWTTTTVVRRAQLGRS